MPDPHYVTPRLCELYDLGSPWSRERQFYLDLAAGPPLHVLDVGCGTGLIAAALASAGHHVTGVDPARGMLDVARDRPGGENVEWVECSAEAYESATDFDLIFMTGNAFQALLERAQAAAFFRNSRRHLAAKGRLAFETRNPDLDWPAMWNYRVDLPTDRGPVPEIREFVDLQGGVMTFDLHYRLPEGPLTSRSRIRFWTPEEVTDLAEESGLQVLQLLGDWDQEFDRRSSREAVFILAPDDPEE